MRELIRGLSEKQVRQKAERMKKQNWKQISEIQVDPTSYLRSEYVCVMENKEKQQNRINWGNRYHVY